MYKRKSDSILYFVLVAMSVFFLINRLMIIDMAIIGFLFICKVGEILKADGLVRTIIAIVALTACQYIYAVVPQLSVYFSSGEATKEIERAILYILILALIRQIELDIRAYQRLWRIILTIVVGICYLQYLKIFNIDSILRNFYGNSVQFYNSAQTSLALFRGGSVFINPNVLACFLVAYLGNYLSLLDIKKESKIYRIITYALVVSGLILAGSRTGLVVSAIEIMIYYLYIAKNAEKTKIVKLLISVIFIFAIICLLSAQSSESSVTTLRAFQVRQGVDNSLSIKFVNFVNVLREGNVLNYLFGYGPIDYASNSKLLIDFEIGYFVVFYGLFGVVFYIQMIRNIIRYGEWNKNYAFQRKRNIMFILIMLLFGFTAGIYLNIRIFAIYLVMFFTSVCDFEELDNEEIYSL